MIERTGMQIVSMLRVLLSIILVPITMTNDYPTQHLTATQPGYPSTTDTGWAVLTCSLYKVILRIGTAVHYEVLYGWYSGAVRMHFNYEILSTFGDQHYQQYDNRGTSNIFSNFYRFTH